MGRTKKYDDVEFCKKEIIRLRDERKKYPVKSLPYNRRSNRITYIAGLHEELETYKRPIGHWVRLTGVTPVDEQTAIEMKKKLKEHRATLEYEDTEYSTVTAYISWLNRKFGLPMRNPKVKRKEMEGLEWITFRVTKQEGPLETRCWIWNGAKQQGGYGMVCFMDDQGKKRSMGAHRYALYITDEDFDESLQVAHLCHNPSCCRPDHLVQATAFENTQMSVENGRKNRKFTADDVRAIREEYEQEGTPMWKIGMKYDASESAVWSVLTGRTYRWVD